MRTLKGNGENVFNKDNFAIGIVMLLITSVLQFEVCKISPASSRMLPQVITAVMFLCSAVSLVQSFKIRRKKVNSNLLFNKKQVMAIIFLAIFCALAPILGFYISLFLLLICEGMLMFDRTKAIINQLLMLTVGSLILTLALSAAFINIFKLITPTGIFF